MGTVVLLKRPMVDMTVTARGGHDSGFTLRPDACVTECKCWNRVQKRAVINSELETVLKV